MELKKIGVWSFVKVAIILGLVFGLIVGIISSFYLSSLADKITLQASSQEMQAYLEQTGNTDIGQLAESLKSASRYVWIVYTIVSVIASFIAGLIVTLVYNATAKYFGGIKIDLVK